MKPTVKKIAGPLEGEVLSHPAFGAITVSRCQGGNTRLHGSDFVHHQYITIAIHASELNRTLSRDWNFPREQLIEVALSEAQWATFVSSLNQGSGIPCTLQRHAGILVPPIWADKSKTDKFGQELTDTIKDGLNALKAALAMISDKKATVAKIRPLIEKALRELGANVPFVSEQFDEHMEDTVEAAKIESHAYLNHLLHRTGIEHMSAPQALISYEEENEPSKN